MSDYKMPNFFIVGAPKCGTTSLWRYLAPHPEVFMPSMKEPHFFNFDHQYRGLQGLRGSAFTWDEYARLFESSGERAKAVGEASVWYLYSNSAVGEAMNRLSNPRFIAMVRNPVDMFGSLHDQLVASGREDLQDAESAWNAQKRRQAGIDLPPGCIEPSHLQYESVCSLGTQIQRLIRSAGADRAHVVVFDHLVRNPRAEYEQVLEFLGLADDGRALFEKANPAKEIRSRHVRRLVSWAHRASHQFNVRLGSGLIERVEHLNQKPRTRPPLDEGFRRRLVEAFSAEVRLLEFVIDTDLSEWKK